jgi:hypothetical protein
MTSLRTLRYLVALHRGDAIDGVRPAKFALRSDDIDHFGNRRLRTVGELIQNQVRIGLSRMERVVRERMTTQDVEAITPTDSDQHPSSSCVNQGVLRNITVVTVHGSDKSICQVLHTSVVFQRLDLVVSHVTARVSKFVTFTHLTTDVCVQLKLQKVQTLVLSDRLQHMVRVTRIWIYRDSLPQGC